MTGSGLELMQERPSFSVSILAEADSVSAIGGKQAVVMDPAVSSVAEVQPRWR